MKGLNSILISDDPPAYEDALKLPKPTYYKEVNEREENPPAYISWMREEEKAYHLRGKEKLSIKMGFESNPKFRLSCLTRLTKQIKVDLILYENLYF